MTDTAGRGLRFAEIFLIFLGLGLRGFGGPVAHIALFREEFVDRRKWLDDRAFAERVAVCNFLPGPSSSQVGMALGFGAGGIPGLFAAFAGFTLPSAVLITAFAYGASVVDYLRDPGVMLGIKLGVVAIVANALVGMARSLCPDWYRAMIAAGAAGIMLVVPGLMSQFMALAGGALLGLLAAPDAVSDGNSDDGAGRRVLVPVILLVVFFVLLIGLPLAQPAVSHPLFDLFTVFYRVGSLVFGGGHVVLPLLDAETVGRGWIDWNSFVVGYGAAQAVPGPMFTFAAYLGALVAPEGAAGPLLWQGALVALVGIFAPSFLLVLGILPLWQSIRNNGLVRRLLQGINAAVVGLLAAVLVSPVLTSALTPDNGPALLIQIATIAILFALMWFAKAPSWLVLLLGIGTGIAVQGTGLV